MSEGILRDKKVCDICGKQFARRLCHNCYETLKRHEKKAKAPQIKCQCGCGVVISSIDTKGRPQRFKWGHHMVGRRGPAHPSWGGGRRMTEQGYVFVYSPNHHFATKKGYVMEHRLVWEKYNNACLLPWADVHHIDGIKTDNRIENLFALTHGEHSRHHRLNVTI